MARRRQGMNGMPTIAGTAVPEHTVVAAVALRAPVMQRVRRNTIAIRDPATQGSHVPGLSHAAMPRCQHYPALISILIPHIKLELTRLHCAGPPSYVRGYTFLPNGDLRAGMPYQLPKHPDNNLCVRVVRQATRGLMVYVATT